MFSILISSQVNPELKIFWTLSGLSGKNTICHLWVYENKITSNLVLYRKIMKPNLMALIYISGLKEVYHVQNYGIYVQLYMKQEKKRSL